MDKRVAILLLAAGESVRMGQPKALLKIGCKTLLERRIEDLKETQCEIFIVTGAYQELISPLLQKYVCTEVHHQNWKSGMGTSIAAGVKRIRKEGFEYVMIVALDQVMVTAQHIVSMIDISFGHPYAIVSAQYGKIKGIPALFPSCYYDELELLQGDKGARKIVMRHKATCLFYHLPEAELDLDTMMEYMEFIQATCYENN